MAFTYTRGSKKPWEIDLKQLRHPYYAQLAADGEHLVPGMLHQGRPPATGRWLQVGTITEPLEERYFVQQTSFNTLVPGLLIQAEERPGANWKDVRKLSANFHYISFDNTPYDVLEPSTEYTIVDSQVLLDEIVMPAVDIIFPGRNPAFNTLFYLYYFYDTIEDMDNNPANLVPFSETSTLRLLDPSVGSYYDYTLDTPPTPNDLTIQPDAEDGYYSIILGVVPPDSNGYFPLDPKAITDYIVLKYLIRKFLPG